MRKITTPICPLEWVRLTNGGTLNFNEDGYIYSVNVLITDDYAEELQEIIDEVYAEEEGAGSECPNEVIKTSDDGRKYVTFKTNVTDKSGRERAAKIVDSKNRPVEFPEGVDIGNGTTGRVSGTVAYYKAGKNTGVTLYFNALQIIDFVPYTGVDEFEEYDGFDGSALYGGGFDVADVEEEAPRRRRRNRG